MNECVFCGQLFSDDDAISLCATCYLTNGCDRKKCPNCGYEHIKESETLNRLTALGKKIAKIFKGV